MTFLSTPGAHRNPCLSAVPALLILFTACHSSLLVAQSRPAINIEKPLTSADQSSLHQALDAYDAGHLEAAEPVLQSLAGKYPTNYEIVEGLGSLYAEQDHLDQALPLLKMAVRVAPRQPLALANLGTAYYKLGQNAQALPALQKAVSLEPGNAQTQAVLGEVYLSLGEPLQASTAFKSALRIDGGNPDLLYNEALALYNAGQTAQSATLLSRLPGVDTSAPAQSLYGDVEEKLGHYKESAQHYINAVQLAPTEANYYVLGIDFLRHLTFDAAVKQFAAGVKTFPDSRRMRFALGVAYYGNGNYDQAIPVLSELLQRDPDNNTYAELLGRTCTILTEGVDPHCREILSFARQHPQNAVLATYAAASILHRPTDADDMETAHQLLDAAIKADAGLPEARYQMGVLLQLQTHWQESIPQLEAAIHSKPDFAQAHYRLALAYSHTGRKEQAGEEVSLQQKYSQQETQSVEGRMKQITTLLVKMQ